MLIHNAEVTGSLKINNVPFNSGSFSGSFRGDGSQLTGVTGATTASYVEYSNVGNKPALVSGSSQITYSGLSGIPSGIVSGSAQVSFNGIVDKPTLVSGSSQVTYSGLSGIPAGIVSGSAQVAALGFATTGSNTFQANQTITGSLFITQNLVVAGSSSIQYISSSVLDIADNIITVNAFNPGVRFGGLAVIDSGSSPQVSGSLLFDSIKDQWIFIHETPGTVTSSVLLMGPETYNDLGNETYLSANRLPKGTGIEHLRDSNITDTGTVVSVNSNTAVTGSFTVVSGSAVELQVTNTGVNIGSISTDNHNVTGNLRVSGSIAVTGSIAVNGTGRFATTSTNPALSITLPGNSNATILEANSGNSGFGWKIQQEEVSTGDFRIFRRESSVDYQVLNLARSTGAATFSSTLQSGALTVSDTTANTSFYNTFNNASNRNWALAFGIGNLGDFNIMSSNAQNGNPISAGTSRLNIQSNGNIGIGTTNPGSFVVLEKSSNSGSGSTFPRLTIKNTLATQGDGSSTFNFADINISSGNEAVNMFLATTFAAGTWAPAGIINVSTNHELQFKTNNTTRLTLANSGAATFSSSVTAAGVTSTATSKFGSSTNFVTTFADGGGVYFENTGTSTATRTLRLQGLNDAGSAYTQFIISHGAGNIRANINDQERIRIDGDGLKFNGDTAAANALDDYEEGIVDITTMTDGVATFTQFVDNRTLSYTKIGNRVFVSGNIYNQSISGVWTNPLRIPLPFAVAFVDGRSRSYGAAALFNWGSTSDNVYLIEAGTSYASLVSAGSGGSWGTITTTAGFTAVVNISYIAAG